MARSAPQVSLLAALWMSISSVASASDVPTTVCTDEATPRAIDLSEAVVSSLSHEPGLIVAREDVMEARSDVTAALAPFMPSIQFALVEERYVPSNGAAPVIVVGNTVLGGAQTKSAYGALSLNWNIMNSGRDIAAYHGAKASLRATSSGLDNQLGETLTGVLQAAADVYEAGVTAQGDANALVSLQAILSRADERFRNGHGTTVAIGQARAAALEAEQSLNRSYRLLAEKSAMLARAIGMRVPVEERLSLDAPLPLPNSSVATHFDLDGSIDSSAPVIEAREKLDAAQAKLRQAQRAFGPTMSLSVRRDYLGQDPVSFANANHHIAPADYRVGLSIEQPLFPFDTEVAQVGKARAQVRRAEAGYEQVWLEAQTKSRSALSARREADASYTASKASLAESERVLSLTESLYRAGRIDLDNVQHAQMDRDKARTEVLALASKRALAAWTATRVLQPRMFPDLLFRELHLRLDARDGRADDAEAQPPTDQEP
jgi:outer membrane protein TolC